MATTKTVKGKKYRKVGSRWEVWVPGKRGVRKGYWRKTSNPTPGRSSKRSAPKKTAPKKTTRKAPKRKAPKRSAPKKPAKKKGKAPKKTPKPAKKAKRPGPSKPTVKDDEYHRTRPSPSDSATLYSEGYQMRGNDGRIYRISVSDSGIHRWVPA